MVKDLHISLLAHKLLIIPVKNRSMLSVVPLPFIPIFIFTDVNNFIDFFKIRKGFLLS